MAHALQHPIIGCHPHAAGGRSAPTPWHVPGRHATCASSSEQHTDASAPYSGGGGDAPQCSRRRLAAGALASLAAMPLLPTASAWAYNVRLEDVESPAMRAGARAAAALPRAQRQPSSADCRPPTALPYPACPMDVTQHPLSPTIHPCAAAAPPPPFATPMPRPHGPPHTRPLPPPVALEAATSGRFAEAERLFRVVLAQDPDSASAHSNLGNVHTAQVGGVGGGVGASVSGWVGVGCTP